MKEIRRSRRAQRLDRAVDLAPTMRCFSANAKRHIASDLLFPRAGLPDERLCAVIFVLLPTLAEDHTLRKLIFVRKSQGKINVIPDFHPAYSYYLGLRKYNSIFSMNCHPL
ncbi:MAG: hypothetical protein AAFY29_19460 [Pseudomonadota bacterium]